MPSACTSTHMHNLYCLLRGEKLLKSNLHSVRQFIIHCIMAGQQRLITDVFAQHKRELSRAGSGKTKVVETTDDVDQRVQEVDNETARQLLRDKEIDVLKQFDLCWQYGPCTGVSRLERWERAEKHGMNPPHEVRRLILKHEDETQYTQSLWHDYPL